jgi:hypothetical protein
LKKESTKESLTVLFAYARQYVRIHAQGNESGEVNGGVAGAMKLRPGQGSTFLAMDVRRIQTTVLSLNTQRKNGSRRRRERVPVLSLDVNEGDSGAQEQN